MDATRPQEVLASIPFFAGLDHDQLEGLVRVSETKRYEKGATLFRQGDAGGSLFVILEGRVKAVLSEEDGREVTLAYLGQGEIVGEMALFDPEEKRSATVVATEGSVLMVLSGARFFEAIQANPGTALAMIRTLSHRLKETSRRVAGLIFLDTVSRLTRFLLDSAEKDGRRLADGSVLIPRPTQEEIAHYIGTSRETVNRLFKELEGQGFIRVVGRKILLYRQAL